MSYKSQGYRDHTYPRGYVWQDKIEQYYKQFITIWQTSESIDEAHHRILDKLDPEIPSRAFLQGRARYLRMRGVNLKELSAHSIDWSVLDKYAQSILPSTTNNEEKL